MENDIVRMLFLRRQRQKKRWKIKTISGAPPLTYKAVAGALKNYRIYGQTSRNLFDFSTVTNGYRIIWATGAPAADSKAIISDYIPINAGRYRSNINIVVACYDSQKNYIGSYARNGYAKDYVPPVNDITLDNTCAYIRIFTYEQLYIQTPLSQSTMFNSGSTPSPYEPYGESVGDLVVEGEHAGEYKVPVTVSNGTDTQTIPIYLPEQIKKVGDEAEYISYADQKLHRTGADDIDVNLPELPTLAGTNALSVGTAVQPSGVSVTGKIKEI